MNNLSFLNKYKLFIVDYDGTILDSMRMWRTLLSNFLNEEGIVYNEDIDEINHLIEEINKEDDDEEDLDDIEELDVSIPSAEDKSNEELNDSKNIDEEQDNKIDNHIIQYFFF